MTEICSHSRRGFFIEDYRGNVSEVCVDCYSIHVGEPFVDLFGEHYCFISHSKEREEEMNLHSEVREKERLRRELDRGLIVCECADHLCPVHPEKDCTAPAEQSFIRYDLAGEPIVNFCEECADDAMVSGLFTVDDEIFEEEFEG